MPSLRPLVLVVEDDRDTRAILGDLLEDEGYAVPRAANGAEAFGLLRSGRPPCVILLDLVMPAMNGWEFRAHQLRDPALRKVPVAVMTAVEVPTDTICRQLSVVNILRKPLRLEEVLAVVAMTCRAVDRG